MAQEEEWALEKTRGGGSQLWFVVMGRRVGESMVFFHCK